jgi:apolipoprotein D and lipocalin family protein
MMRSLLRNAINNLIFKRYLRAFQASALGLIPFLQGCAFSPPAEVTPVAGFDVHQYLGRWYEIARLDNRFQRGLEQVMATYSLRKDGSICVENTGWHTQTGQQKTVTGKARFVADKKIGHLKVSFWGPFYSSYVVFYLEDDYSVAMVCGSSRNYCWILARSPMLPADDLAKYRSIAKDNGFAVENFKYAPSVISPVEAVER